MLRTNDFSDDLKAILSFVLIQEILVNQKYLTYIKIMLIYFCLTCGTKIKKHIII
jgi:hypothetical protein